MDAERGIEMEDVYLKKADPGDWQEIWHNLWCRPECARYMLWNVTRSEEDALARMERTIAYQREHPLSFFVYEKRTGKAIGFAGLIETEPGVFEDTGLALGPAFWGKGYGTQVVRANVEEAEAAGARKLIASCREQNEASRALQRKCGFVFTHKEKRTDPRNGEPYVLEFSELILRK